MQSTVGVIVKIPPSIHYIPGSLHNFFRWFYPSTLTLTLCLDILLPALSIDLFFLLLAPAEVPLFDDPDNCAYRANQDESDKNIAGKDVVDLVCWEDSFVSEEGEELEGELGS